MEMDAELRAELERQLRSIAKLAAIEHRSPDDLKSIIKEIYYIAAAAKDDITQAQLFELARQRAG